MIHVVQQRAPQGEVFVRLENLTKIYEEGDRTRTVFRDLNGDIRKGEFVVLFGRSGSGKSTLLNLISGIDLPTSGEVSIDGTNLTRLSERDRTLFRRKHIGFVFQALNLLPTLTVAENVLLPLELNGAAGRKERNRVQELLDAVGLGDRSDGFPDRLSGGEQQRVAIARALVHEPLLLLADEPTGNLDEVTGRQVTQIFERLVRRTGQTLVLVTHDHEWVPLADRVLVLENGKLHEREPALRQVLE